MAQTIDIYRSLLAKLRQRGIREALEVGPGGISLPAIGNAMLRCPLRYFAQEPDPDTRVRLRTFCGGLGTPIEFIESPYDTTTIGTRARCVIFEHSLEDLFLATLESAPAASSSFDGPHSACGRFVASILAHAAKSQFGAVILHHYRVPFLSSDVRTTLDPFVSGLVQRSSDFAPTELWRSVDVLHSPRLADEVWRVYLRGPDGA